MLDSFAKVGVFFKETKGLRAFAYAGFLGVVAALALPPYPFVPLFFIAIVCVLLLLAGQEKVWHAFGYGYCFGLGHFGLSMAWVANSFYAQAGVPEWTAPIMVTLMVMILSLFPAIAFLITRLLWHKHWFQRAMGFAGIFAFLEYGRGFFTDFPWNPVSLIWWPSDAMSQALSILGSSGLGIMTLLMAGLLTPLFDGTVGRKHRLITPAVSLAIVVGFLGFGGVRLYLNQPTYNDDLVVRLVQPNIPQVEKWSDPLLLRNLSRHLNLSVSEPGEFGTPDIVIWGETAFPFNLEGSFQQDGELVRYSEATMNWMPDQVLITGANRNVLEPEPQLNNSLYVLDGPGDILGRYDKSKLVPFGEYVPFRWALDIFGLQTLVPGTRDFNEGPGITTMNIEGIPAFSPLICYEIVFSDRVADDNNPPEWILNITNDAWFGDSAGPRQHFQMARARAIEEGIPVLRVAGTGISAAIGPYGRVLAALELNEQGILDTPLPQKSVQKTIFSIAGIGPAGALALIFFIFGAGSGRTERGRKEENT